MASTQTRYPQLADRAWLRRAYLTDGQSIRQIAAGIGATSGAVRAALHRHRIPVRPGGPKRLAERLGRDRLLAVYGQAGSARAAADTLGVSVATMLSALSDVGVTARKNYAHIAEVQRLAHPILDDPERLALEYMRLGGTKLARLIGCSRDCVYHRLDAYGIATRRYPRMVRPRA